MLYLAFLFFSSLFGLGFEERGQKLIRFKLAELRLPALGEIGHQRQRSRLRVTQLDGRIAALHPPPPQPPVNKGMSD